MKIIVTLDVMFLHREFSLSLKATETQISSIQSDTELNFGKTRSTSYLFSFLEYSFPDLLTESLKCFLWILLLHMP